MIVKYRDDLIVDFDLAVGGEQGPPGERGADGAPGASIVGPPGERGVDGRGWTYRGEWTPSSQFAEGDVTSHEGSTYLATRDNRDREPPNRRYWGVVALRGERGEDGRDGFGSKGVKGDMGETGETIVVGSVEKFPAIFDSPTLKGQVVYVSGDGHVDLALGTGYPQSLAIGLANGDGDVVTSGPFTNEAWSLTPGTVYYLSSSSPGGMTPTFPNTIGDHVIILGAAITPTQINLEIHWALIIGS